MANGTITTPTSYATDTMSVFWPTPDPVARVERRTLEQMLRNAYQAGEDNMLRRVAKRLDEPVEQTV